MSHCFKIDLVFVILGESVLYLIFFKSLTIRKLATISNPQPFHQYIYIQL